MEQKKSYYNCSVDGCLNSTLNGELSFFKLPVVSERRTEWLRLIHREDLIDSSCFHARVCEAHFSADCIRINSRRKLLKRNSIPQLLLPLLNNFENKGIQAIIETADANVQCDYNLRTNAQVQTPLHLSNDTPRKRKLLSELQRCRKRLKMTNNIQSEANTFFKLCDKFLTPTFARVVKQQTKIITQGHGNRIPKKEPIRQKWIDAIGYVPKRKDPVVCSSHFRPEELTFAGLQAQLTPDAVPSIFPTEPTAPLIAAPPSPGPSQSTIDALDSDASTEYLEEPQDHLTPQRQVFSVSNASTKPQDHLTPQRQVFSVSNASTKPQDHLTPQRQVFSVSKASTKPQDPLKQDTKQCRFCGKYSEDCVPISPTHLASVTTKLAFNDIVVQFSESLPKTVCKDCDVKLQVIYDFVQYAKTAQELLIDVEDGEEVVEVKHEYEEDDETDDSLQEDNDSDEERKEQIVDLITAGETVFTKDNKKRKSNAIRVAKPKKTKVAKSESGNEEVIDRDDTDDEADNIGFSNSDTRTNKPSDAKFAKRVFVRKVRIDGNS